MARLLGLVLLCVVGLRARPRSGPISAGGLSITVPESATAVAGGVSSTKSTAKEAATGSGSGPISAGGLRITVPESATTVVVGAASAQSTAQGIEGDQQKEEAFLRWLRAKGAKVQGLAIKRDKNGNRGVYATQRFVKDEVIMLIPHELVLNSATVKASARDAGSPLSKYLGGDFLSRVELQDCCLVALFIMFERFLNQQSPWSPYLDILPTSVSTPVTWTEESHKLELQLLRTAPGLRNTYEKHMKWLGAPDNWVAQLRRALLPAVSRDFGVSEEQLLSWLLWAFAAVTSRAWGSMQIEHGEPSGCNMIPMADMLNHHRDANDISFMEPPNWSGSTSASAGAGWGTTANWDIMPGDEVFDTYSKEKDSVLCRGVGLISFGFVDLSHNSTDCTWLQITVGEHTLSPGSMHAATRLADQEWHAADRASMLQHIADAMEVPFVFELRHRETAAFDLPAEMLGTMRLLHLTRPSEVERARDATQNGHPIPILSLANEQQTLRSLKQVFQQMLAKFPSEVSDDAARIAQLTNNASVVGVGSAVGDTAVLCVRLGEFKLYKRALQKVDEMWLKLLDADADEDEDTRYE